MSGHVEDFVTQYGTDDFGFSGFGLTMFSQLTCVLCFANELGREAVIKRCNYLGIGEL